jgi:signal transduction histidine kinase
VDWASEPGAAGRSIRTVSAVAAVIIAVTVALHRGLFAHPDWQWLALVAAVAPFLIDLRWPPRRAGGAFALLSAAVAGLAALIAVEPPGPDVSLLLLLVVAARVGAGAPARVSVPVGLTAIGLLVYLVEARPGVTSIAMIIGLAFAWSAGLAMRMQADLTRRLLQARGELTAAAAREERQRVARDIHDVVAHTMSVTMLHLAGARLALAEGERDEAMDSLRQAEVSGRAAMADIRQTIGLLRDPQSTVAPPLAPSPAPARDLADLVASFVDAGLKVDYQVDGDPSDMPAPVAHAVYPIVREALSNAARHSAGGAAEVGLSVAGERVRLSVRNNHRGGPVGAGHGIAGMRQRARLAGGSLIVGPDGDRWCVDAAFPGQP